MIPDFSCHTSTSLPGEEEKTLDVYQRKILRHYRGGQPEIWFAGR